MVLTLQQNQELISLIQGGLPLCSQPYAELAKKLGITEEAVIQGIKKLQKDGTIKRMGIVVRHHELGYTANAMVVWDVPDTEVERVGNALSKHRCVTLCYQRPRRLPNWSYNLFCMIHGKKREQVLKTVSDLIQTEALQNINYAVLFSGQRFKQRGAKYR